jgi:polysaccharide pyruvyl transferase WcaK-like protein
MPSLKNDTQGRATSPKARVAPGIQPRGTGQRNGVRHRIGLFGHFGDINFGNESTLQSLLYHLRSNFPSSEITCICTDPAAVTRTYNIDTLPMGGVVVKPTWLRGNSLARFVRRLIIGIPSEPYRWFQALLTLKRLDVLIVAGTGLLTDISGLLNWGPYSLFKWSLLARACRCKLLFVSVGAGPLYGSAGRVLTKAALRLATFRSYRDNATKQFLDDLGVRTGNDGVYPDLAFSLPRTDMPAESAPRGTRPVAGLGLMLYAGRQSADRPSEAIYAEYLESLVVFVRWLLDHNYDIRLLTGDVCDRPAVRDLLELLKERSVHYQEGRVLDEPVLSVEHLLWQLSKTDLVVATRFHNVLLALLLNKPAISISFHQKCDSLMSAMGLPEYSQDIKQLSPERLIEQFCELERNAPRLKRSIAEKTDRFRSDLDEQYDAIVKEILTR